MLVNIGVIHGVGLGEGAEAELTNTTRKPAKTNGITHRIFSSVILTDGNNSVSKSVGIYRQIKSISNMVGIYQPYHRWPIQFVWKVATVW